MFKNTTETKQNVNQNSIHTHRENRETKKKMKMNNNNNNLWNDWAREKKHNKTKFGQIVAKKTKYFSLHC